MGVAAAPVAAPAARAPVVAKPPVAAVRPALRLVQRSCDCGGTAGLSGVCDSCSGAVLRRQRQASAPDTGGELAPAVVHEALSMTGQPLDAAARAALESRLGHDFGRVRIHTGPLADTSARAVGANAYTVGQDVVFRAGQYRPGTASGDRLLAHELTHTVQQAQAAPTSTLRVGPANDAHERAASAAAMAPTRAPVAAVQREIVQRDGGILDSLAGASADLLWAAVKKIAPAALIDIIQSIRAKGIIGFLKDKLSPIFSRLFGGLSPASGGFIAGLVSTFTQVMGTARTVLAALANNDCKPLFDALGKLGDALGTMAGEAWDKLKAFLAPVGDFFTGLWHKFGAPVVDFLTDVAAAEWNAIKSIGAQLWSIVSSIGSTAWGWLKRQLGIGDGADDQNGLLQWVQGKLGEAWDAIKGVINPVIAPMKALASSIVAALPIDAILHLRERVHEFLQHAGSMVGSLQNPKGVTVNQGALKGQILPAIKAAIVSLGGQIANAGGWVAGQIGGLVQTANGLLASIKSNSILGLASSAIDWVGDKIKALGDWVQSGVRGLFDIAGQGVAKLSGFVDPLLGVLQKLASVIGNVVKALPGLVMGPVWALIPACIRDPIKDFIVQHILSEIPIISTFVKLPDIWAKIQKLVLDFLYTVFVDGNLGGAVMMVVRFILEAAGVDVNMFLRVIAKAISSIDDIMMHPMNFLRNIGSAIVMGFQQFGRNIGSNLIAVLQSWLLGPLAALGVMPLKDLSFGSIFQFVMQVLGITMAKLKTKLEKAVGPKAMGVINTAADIVSKAWHWLTILWAKGPAGVWAEVKDQAAGIGTSIIAGITSWITTDLIKIGIAKLAKLSNPVGEIIELIQTIAKTIDFVVTKMNKILAMAEAVLDSIGNIVKGKLAPAATAVESALVKALGAALAFFAEWLGVSDPGEKIKEIVEKIQTKVDGALDWLISKAIAAVQKLFGKGDKAKPDDNPKWTTAVAGITADIEQMSAAEGFSGTSAAPELVKARIPEWKTRYGFTTLELQQTEDDYEIDGSMSPRRQVIKAGKPGSKKNPIPFNWVKPAVSGYPNLKIGKKSYGPTDTSIASDPLIGDLKLGVKYSKALSISNGAVIEAEAKEDGNSTKDSMRETLVRRGWDNSGLDVDHIWEKQVGGPDAKENLWPLDSSTNRSSGSNVRQERNRVMDELGYTGKKLGLDRVWLKLKF
jgi:hypothetical protein